MSMTLNPESLEKAARAGYETGTNPALPKWLTMRLDWRRGWLRTAQATVSAYLEAEVRSGRATSYILRNGQLMKSVDALADGDQDVILLNFTPQKD